MPPEYNPIHHGQLLQITGELGLGPDDVAAILQVDASIIKRCYSGKKNLLPNQLKTLLELHITWWNKSYDMYKDFEAADLTPCLLVYYTQEDYVEAPQTGFICPTYKMHINLMARVISHNGNYGYLIPFQKGSYASWLQDRPDDETHRQQWANLIADIKRS
jgi:hypothetical protein